MNYKVDLKNKNNTGKKPKKIASFVINRIIDQNPSQKVNKNSSITSSELNWGKSHTSIPTTPQTAKKSTSSSKTSNENESKIIVALTEGRGEARHEVGLAAICVSKPLLILCQISDSQSYINTQTKINLFDPNEILIPNTFVDNAQENRLLKILKEKFPNKKFIATPRSIFNKRNGIDVISDLCIPSLNGILLVLQHKYYALSAASALINHIQDNLFVYYAAGTIKIEYQESEGNTIIDISTADHLELVCSVRPAEKNKYASLLGVMNHCQTKIGARMLRSSILQPLYDIEALKKRINCVSTLVKQPELLLSVQALLQKISNIDYLLTISTIVVNDPQKCSNRQLNYLLILNSLIDLLEPLKEVISNQEQPFFLQLTKTLDDEAFDHIKKLIRNVIQDGAHPATGQSGILQRCFAIKPGLNGLLDLVRKTYSERINDMKEYVKSLADKYGLPLTLHNNHTKGYHIVMTIPGNRKRTFKKSELPEEFVQVQRLASKFTVKTAELMNLSTRIEDIMMDVLKISNAMVHTLIVELKQYIPLFYTLCEEIAYLDFIQSLAETSHTLNYVKPIFGEFTELTKSRHPLLDFLLSTKPVANSISCSNDFNIHIITGPNGSGKSILIRQVLLLQVMAQVGCYVPAETAYFRPADRIFARINSDGNAEYGASSFLLELKEIQYIMNAVTKDSLVIIDELGRSTSLEDGTALAMAIVEKLAQSTTYLFVATHFTLLAKLYDMYPNVKLWQLETVPNCDDLESFKLTYKYNLIPGVTSLRRYGVYIVRGNWPDSILKYIDEVLLQLSTNTKNTQIFKLDEKYRLKYKIEADFRILKSLKKLTLTEINRLLKKYQNDLQKLGFLINVQQLDKYNLLATISATDWQSNPQQYQPQETFNDNDSYTRDYLEIERAMNAFTPEESMQNYLIEGVDSHIEGMFTPEPPTSVHNNGKNDDSNNYQSIVYENINNCTFEDNSSESSNYKNVSNFLAEDSENVYKLVPEIRILPDDSTTSNGFNAVTQHFPLNSVGLQGQENCFSVPEYNNYMQHINRSPADISENLSNAVSLPISPTTRNDNICPVYSEVISLRNSNNTNTVATFRKNDLENFEVESIRNELEIFSQVFSENEHFGEDTPPPSQSLVEFEKQQYISPIIHVIEGPNNTTLSIDENVLSCDMNDSNCNDNNFLTPLENDETQVNYKEAYNADEQNNTAEEEYIEQYSQCNVLTLQNPEETYDEKEFSSAHSCDTFKTCTSGSITQNLPGTPYEHHQIVRKAMLSHANSVFNINKSVNISSENNNEEARTTEKNSSFKSNEVNDEEMITNFSSDDQKQQTTISDASRLRNLEGSSPSSSADNNNDENDNSHYENAPDNKISPTSNQVKITMPITSPSVKNSDASSPKHEDLIILQPQEDKTKSSSSHNDQRNSTSISEASKLRNLDGTHSISSTDSKKEYAISTSLTDVSNKRHLDDSTTGSPCLISYEKEDDTLVQEIKENFSDEELPTKKIKLGKTKRNRNGRGKKRINTTENISAKSEVEDSTRRKGKTSSSRKAKMSAIKNSTSSKENESIIQAEGSSTDKENSNNTQPKKKKIIEKHSSTTNSGRKLIPTFKRFKPPKKLTAKEIREDFEKQDSIILDKSAGSSDMSKYYQQLINRPTVRQIQNSTPLATLVRTSEGVQVIPAESEVKEKTKFSLFKKYRSNESINVNIFSDRNAEHFEQYLNSKEKDYKNFNLISNKRVEIEDIQSSSSNIKMSGETSYIFETMQSTSFASCFQKKSVNSLDHQDLFIGRTAFNDSLTPDGYYKRNKEDILNIMQKYLTSTQSSSHSINIFEDDNISNEDLEL